MSYSKVCYNILLSVACSIKIINIPKQVHEIEDYVEPIEAVIIKLVPPTKKISLNHHRAVQCSKVCGATTSTVSDSLQQNFKNTVKTFCRCWLYNFCVAWFTFNSYVSLEICVLFGYFDNNW